MIDKGGSVIIVRVPLCISHLYPMECYLYVASGKWRTLVLSPAAQPSATPAIKPLALTFSPVYETTTSTGGSSVAIQIMNLSSADNYSLRRIGGSKPIYGSLGLIKVANGNSFFTQPVNYLSTIFRGFPKCY